MSSLINELKVSDANINVFIIGLRGYTQDYGGWESFAHGLLDNWVDNSIHFYAFEKVNDEKKEEIVEVNNVTCIRVCETEEGSSAMMKYDRRCTDLACEFTKLYNIKNPILYHLGVRIGPYLWLKRKQIKKLGINMIENPAGAECRRTKWNKLVQVYLFISAIMMAKSTDYMVCDNEGIRQLYKKILIGKKPRLECIAYGVEEADKVDNTMPEKVKVFFDKWHIQRDQYYLILGRYVPENNYEMMIKGFMKSDTKRKLLIITNYKEELEKFHEYILSTTNFLNDDRIIMAGTLYDKEILSYIRQYAHGYIHGHSVGGTNPGLLEAMSETDVNLLYDVSFNRFIGKNAALYFSDTQELVRLIHKVDFMPEKEKKMYGIKARAIMKREYSWEKIVDEYDALFCRILKERKG